MAVIELPDGAATRPVGVVAALPAPAGELSEAMVELLRGLPTGVGQGDAARRLSGMAARVADPTVDDDLQLALFITYELAYRSFDGVDPGWEWDPALLEARAALERPFLAALRESLPPLRVDAARVGDLLFELEAADDGPSVGQALEREPDLERFREFVVHRSLYQLKEADPHSWAIPRLGGPPKSALVEVQADEYGGGDAARMHSALFAKTMRALDLDDAENGYLEHVPGATLATVNLMSGLGLRRERRGAIVGHLAMFEMTSAGPNRRYGNALRKLGLGAEATDFYDEHVEADAVHENIAAYDLAGALARREPELAEDVVFGARALLEVEARFARHVLSSWEGGACSLRRPL